MAQAARLLLYALVFWAPLPLGSNRAIFWVINALVASVILVLFVGGELRSRHDSRFDWRPLAWVMSVIVIWAVWMVIQAVPYTPKSLHHPIWSEVAEALPGLRGAISINPSTTWATIAEFVPIVLLGVVAARLANDGRRARVLLNVIAVACVVVALYGLMAFALGLDRVVWLDDASFEGYLTGTFIGRSAAATYFVVGVSCACALMLARIETVTTRQGDASWSVQLPAAAGAAFPYLVALAILVVAIFFTGSRGGIIAAALALIVTMWLSVRRSRGGRRAMAAIVVLGAVGLIALAVLSSHVILDRLAAGGIIDDNRRQIYSDTIRMIMARPLLGQGAGTFADAFPLFNNNADIGRVWIRAHSSYLQGAAELGLPVFGLVMIAILGVLVVTWVGSGRKAAPTPASVAALGAAIATGVQSAVDFSVQLQGISLTLVALVGAGFGEAVAGRSRLRVSGGRGDSVPDPIAVPHNAGRTEAVRIKVPVRTTSSAEPRAVAETSPGRRIYVFADIHGRLDLLENLRAAIIADMAGYHGHDAMVIGLGDFVDRGPRSRGVIEALSTNHWFGCQGRFLRGNHEQMMLNFLDDPERNGMLWFRNGAAETYRSYVGDNALLEQMPVDYAAVRDRLAAAMPPRHLEWLRNLPTSIEDGGYFFAHAGARPGVPLASQREADLMWIREGFSDRDVPFEKVVVHGHTPVDQPYSGKHRINLDTGAYFTNRLSCMVLEGGTRRLIDARPHSSQQMRNAN